MPSTRPPLGSRVLQHIGLITAYWSALEAQMEFAILRTQEINPSEGLIITSHLSFRAKKDLLMTFANGGAYEPEAEAAELKRLLGDIQNAYGLRNNVAHHVWSATGHPHVARRQSIKARGTLQIIDEEVHLSQLAQDAEMIRALGERLLQFMERHGLAPKDGTDDAPNC